MAPVATPLTLPSAWVQDLGGGEAGIDLGAELLGLLAEPLHDVAHADDVVALIVHLGRRRQRPRTLGREKLEPVLGDRRMKRGLPRLPVRNQLVQGARLEHRAREGVTTELGRLLEYADRDLALALDAQLAQPDGGREAGRSGTDDDDVELHALAFHDLPRLARFSRMVAPGASAHL